MVSPSTQCGLVKVAAGGGGSTGACFREEECGQECSTVTTSQCSATTETQCQVQHVMIALPREGRQNGGSLVLLFYVGGVCVPVQHGDRAAVHQCPQPAVLHLAHHPLLIIFIITSIFFVRVRADAQ